MWYSSVLFSTLAAKHGISTRLLVRRDMLVIRGFQLRPKENIMEIAQTLCHPVAVNQDMSKFPQKTEIFIAHYESPLIDFNMLVSHVFC